MAQQSDLKDLYTRVLNKDSASLPKMREVVAIFRIQGFEVDPDPSVSHLGRVSYQLQDIATLGADGTGAFVQVRAAHCKSKLAPAAISAYNSIYSQLKAIAGFTEKSGEQTGKLPFYLLKEMVISDLELMVNTLLNLGFLVTRSDQSQAAGAVQSPPAHKSRKAKARDFVEELKRNIELGEKAEGIVYRHETEKLQNAGKPELAAKVSIVSSEYDRGYDILSYDLDGLKKQIEVKCVKGTEKNFTCYLTENERRKSTELRNYHLYGVLNVTSDNPRVLEFSHPNFESNYFKLSTVVHRLSFTRE